MVAIGGGGGVATESGSIYFLSPEKLDGTANGTENQPNLYVAGPGQAPKFIATLSPNDSVLLDSVKEAETRHTADFQVTTSGEFAAFVTTEPLEASYESAGYAEVYRYDAATGELLCASCDPTNAEATGNASLASNGLSLTDDGRLFFNSLDALSPRALNEKENVYEWETGTLALISTGTSPYNSSVLGVTANGINAYFFTRDTLVPQDHNGQSVKLYDARSNGGFFILPESPPCRSSDECHGAGSSPPLPPAFKSTAASGDGNIQESSRSGCHARHARRHGKCVVRHTHRTAHRHKAHKARSQRGASR